MANQEYKTLTVESEFSFRVLWNKFVLQGKSPLVQFVVSEKISDTCYETIQKEILRNNRSQGRFDRILHPRVILGTKHRPEIQIRTVEELEATYQERGVNFIAVIPFGTKYPIEELAYNEPNPLAFNAMLLGIRFKYPETDSNYEWLLDFLFFYFSVNHSYVIC